MRKPLVILLVALIYALINWYIGLRGYQWLQAASPGLSGGLFYWILFAVVSSAFLITRMAGSRMVRPLRDWLTRVGSLWLLLLLYLLPLLALLDLLRLLASWWGWRPDRPTVAATGGLILLSLAAAIVYGLWRARHPVVVRYEITIPKAAGPHKELQVVLVSDTHLGAINGPDRLDALVAMVGELKPDLLLLAGDIIDDDFGPSVARAMAPGLRRLRARLGTYAVPGNHEYISGHVAEYREMMAEAGITVLADERVMVGGSLWLIGRDDLAGRWFRGGPRKPLAELAAGLDRSLPIFLMDHQPYRLDEAEQAGIDLQVSGHTHRGQVFPNHLITRRHFELDWGYLQKGGLHVIVSLGFGTWGPPVRIGNRPEVVSIRVHFTGEPLPSPRP